MQERVRLWDEIVENEKNKYNNSEYKKEHNKIQVTVLLKSGDNDSTVERRLMDEVISGETAPIEIAKRCLPQTTIRQLIVARLHPYVPPHGQQKLETGLQDDNNGELWDLTRPLTKSCSVEFLTFDHPRGKEVFWHSSAHLLGCAMEQHLAHCNLQLCDGPPLVNNLRSGEAIPTHGGFFYEAHIGDESVKFGQQDFETLERRMKQISQAKHHFERIEVSREVARKMFSYNPFKQDIIDSIPEGESITLYRCGDLIDLCRGPHVPHTGMLKAFKLHKFSGAYWRGQEDGPTLHRVYGIAFPSADMLKRWEEKIEEAARRDHRAIGKNQALFTFHEHSPGSPFFQPHGTRVFLRLMEYMRSEYRKRGYEEVISPQVFDKELWQTSGHWQHYKDDMFIIENQHHGDGKHVPHPHGDHDHDAELMGVKPMNCPGHCLMFGSKLRSYRELPVRWADFSPLHRNELSGALSGLTRVRRFHQDDSHIFCTPNQVPEEIQQCLDFVQHVYSVFGFKVHLTLSTRPESFVGEIHLWDQAEAALKESLDSLGEPWEINEGDGAFYGPKIDIIVEDSLERRHQCATIQLDFQLPQRFGLKYQDKDGKLHTPVIIHRAILGSMERFMALLIEHIGGRWPFWLSPRQCIICPVSEKFRDYAHEVARKINESASNANAYFHVDVDETDHTLKKKIREAQVSQYNYIVVVGQQEMEANTLNLRKRDGEVVGTMNVEELMDIFHGHMKDLN